MWYKKMSAKYLLWFLSVMAFTACNDSNVYNPKPRGYYRIDIKDVGYKSLPSGYPYSFEYSDYATIDKYIDHDSSDYWIYIAYEPLNAVVYVSYKTFADDSTLNSMINDSRTMVFKQINKADDILESSVLDDENHVYGKIYETIGDEAACPYQFWLTDKQKHFFRASVYMGCKPQNDSLQPVIDYVKKDMLHLIETFQWTH